MDLKFDIQRQFDIYYVDKYIIFLYKNYIEGSLGEPLSTMAPPMFLTLCMGDHMSLI